MKTALIVAGCALWAVSQVAAQGAGTGGGRQRAGTKDARCGSDLVVVLPDGQKRQYPSIGEFLKEFPGRQIDQGEQERKAVAVEAVLKAYGADWMEALACDNRSVQLPSGMPFEGRDYLVLTGKQGLKSVREVRPGAFGNTLAEIRKLTLHKVSPPSGAKGK
jgi:hypothetical protein